jgi:uncharacterized protein (TIGR03435 family)
MLKFALVLALCGGALFAQAPAQPLSFEVASVKAAGPLDPSAIVAGKMRIGMKVDAARVDIGMFSLADLVRVAYRVKGYQVQGPDWITTERFNVTAKLPEGAKEDQVPEMLQTLLAERFKLTIHRMSKEQNVYALTVAKDGPKMKPAEPETAESKAAASAASGTIKMSGDIQGKGVVVAGGSNGNQTKMTMSNGLMHMENSRLAMDRFVELLARFVDKPVVDQTELKGEYQVAIDLSMEDLKSVARSSGMMNAATAGPAAGGAAVEAADPSSSVFTSVKQLGLKLEPRKAPVEMIVVDHAERTPTEN